MHDGILVGSNTLRNDNPQLNSVCTPLHTSASGSLRLCAAHWGRWNDSEALASTRRPVSPTSTDYPRHKHAGPSRLQAAAELQEGYRDAAMDRMRET